MNSTSTDDTNSNDEPEWEVDFSETKQIGSRISFKSWRATVFASDEEEVRKIMAEEEPGKSIDRIKRL